MKACGVTLVEFGAFTCASDMLEPFAINRVFTREEQMRSSSGVTLSHWAGRLAAKRAVLDLLGVDVTEVRLFQVQIVPAPTVHCRGDHRCLHGHPPTVVLDEELSSIASTADVSGVAVSITHTDTTALAVAIAINRARPTATREFGR